MKRLVLVLLVLGLSVPAIADVFIYNLKQSGVEFAWDDGANDGDGAWVHPPTSDDLTYGHKMYIVIQVDSDYADATNINIESIDTYKQGDIDDNGKMIRTDKTIYYTLSGWDAISFLQATIAKKNTWIVEGTLSSSDLPTNIMVSGQTKSTMIGTTSYIIAATLSGYEIYGSGDITSDGDVSGGTGSLTLNSTITKAVVSQVLTDGGDIDNEDDVDTAIGEYFDGLGYESD